MMRKPANEAGMLYPGINLYPTNAPNPFESASYERTKSLAI
jgi:hypothetical protein